MGSTVYVKNISYTTSEKDIKEFFSFCGKITKVQVISAGLTQNATVTFERETAAKTALLLDRTTLGKGQVSVSSTSSLKDDHDKHNADDDSDKISQEQKPRSRIIAEYIAHGYAIGDATVQRAIDLDEKHGVSTKFIQTLQSLNAKTQATNMAKSVDQSYGITNTTAKTANSILQSLTSFCEKATGTPNGQKIVDFYTQSQSQVADIHKEARRLADIQKAAAAGASAKKSSKCMCGSTMSVSCAPGVCTCAPGACVCVNCHCCDTQSQTQAAGIHTNSRRPTDMQKETVAGASTKKSNKCMCGSTLSVSCGPGDCTCAPEACACVNCCEAQSQSQVAAVNRDAHQHGDVKEASTGAISTVCMCGSTLSASCVPGACTCAPGACACVNCCEADEIFAIKNITTKTVTTCNCGGDRSACSCKVGFCACSAPQS